MARAIKDLPQTQRELEIIAAAVSSELKSQLFFFVPSPRARYYESNVQLNSQLTTAFPIASQEILRAGNCYAFGEYTASVFHSMRAAEIALRAVAKHLGVVPSVQLESADWQLLINQIDEKLNILRGQPKTIVRDEELKFFSDANSQFFSFKEAIRKYVAHARDAYEEVPSVSILHRTREFLEVLSRKVSE